MATWTPAENFLIGQNIDETSTTAKHALGTRVKMKHATYGVGEFIYLLGAGATAVGSVVTYFQDNHATALAAANSIGPIATAMAATGSGSYGWYQIHGKGVAKVLASFADNADCYLTATSGSIDDADVAGDYIRGMRGASAIGTPSTGLAEVEMWYPSVADGLDN